MYNALKPQNMWSYAKTGVNLTNMENIESKALAQELAIFQLSIS